jgi:hypothetical protein
VSRPNASGSASYSRSAGVDDYLLASENTTAPMIATTQNRITNHTGLTRSFKTFMRSPFALDRSRCRLSAASFADLGSRCDGTRRQYHL